MRLTFYPRFYCCWWFILQMWVYCKAWFISFYVGFILLLDSKSCCGLIGYAGSFDETGLIPLADTLKKIGFIYLAASIALLWVTHSCCLIPRVRVYSAQRFTIAIWFSFVHWSTIMRWANGFNRFIFCVWFYSLYWFTMKLLGFFYSLVHLSLLGLSGTMINIVGIGFITSFGTLSDPGFLYSFGAFKWRGFLFLFDSINLRGFIFFSDSFVFLSVYSFLWLNYVKWFYYNFCFIWCRLGL